MTSARQALGEGRVGQFKSLERGTKRRREPVLVGMVWGISKLKVTNKWMPSTPLQTVKF